MPVNTVFTIGHSSYTYAHFLEMLQEHSINVLIDVRTVPRSTMAPHFDKELLEPLLKDNNIAYQSFAEHFGAKPSNMAMLDADGKVNYDKVRRSPEFLKGISKLRNLVAEEKTVVLMCAEANPIEYPNPICSGPWLPWTNKYVLHTDCKTRPLPNRRCNT
jgi:uncharacterized protein (DUF488 family)